MNGLQPDDSLMVVGTAEGLVSIQRRKVEEMAVKRKKKPVTFRYAVKGKTYVPKQVRFGSCEKSLNIGIGLIGV